MAHLESPPAAEPRSNGAAPPPRWAGDDAVPRGLAIVSAITLRVAIVVGGVVLLGLFAKRMMVVVLPVLIALLLATLLVPGARWLQRRRVPAAMAAFLMVALATVVFLGLWALIIPTFVSQVPDLVESIQQGAGQVASITEPIGVSADEARSGIDRAVADLKSQKIADRVLTGALLVTQWLAAVVLIVVLTFFFVKDGGQIWDWIVGLFADHRRAGLHEVGERAWAALASYIQGVVLVATIDAVLIGAALLVVGVPMAMPLIVLTFVAAFFPIVGSVLAGAAAVLVALVASGLPAALVIGVVIVVVQQLEGNVFYPVVVGRRLRLHPVAILLALTAGAVLAGVAGAFLAIPVAAVTAAVLDYHRTRRATQRKAAVVAP
jgi:putative heme transporter